METDKFSVLGETRKVTYHLQEDFEVVHEKLVKLNEERKRV